MIREWVRRWRRLDTLGTAAVEFALVTPVLMTLSIGGIDYGNLLNGSQAISAAARVGAETARNDATCKSGIQVLNSPPVSNACSNKITAAMQTSGNFSPALIPGSYTLTCKCDSDRSTIPCTNPSPPPFGNSCATAVPPKGNNMLFITISASQAVSPLITWPFFPDTITGYMTVRLQ